MNIEIRKMNEDKCYQVRITERLSESDNFHKVDRITTSPTFTDKQGARNWLIKYLSQ